EAEVLELTLKDLFEDFTAPAWEEKPYSKGDRVTLGSTVYRAVRDMPAQPYWTGSENVAQYGQAIPSLTGWYIDRHPFWEVDVSNAALRDRGANSFLDTDRGLAVRAHVVCRMRKEAMRRLRGRVVTLTYKWDQVRDVTL